MNADSTTMSELSESNQAALTETVELTLADLDIVAGGTHIGTTY
jgi:hypothetical protein